MRGNDLEERMLNFAVRIVRMSEAMPKTAIAKHIGLQVVRSGTSAGANYEEARGAESNKDFVHKLGLSLKELRETRYWLKIISKADLLPSLKMAEILQESDELCRIIGKSIITSKKAECD